MQAELRDDSVRDGLIAMLPRLRRFAEVLIGEREAGTALLGRALNRMLAERSRYQRGTPLDRWAFAEIYRLWLDELRNHADPMRRPIAVEAGFAELMAEDQDSFPDDLTVSFIANLPPQQRTTLLLVYGEGFSHEDAAKVLDCPVDTIEARLIRASASLANAIEHPAAAALQEEEEMADVTPLHPQELEELRDQP